MSAQTQHFEVFYQTKQLRSLQTTIQIVVVYGSFPQTMRNNQNKYGKTEERKQNEIKRRPKTSSYKRKVDWIYTLQLICW